MAAKPNFEDWEEFLNHASLGVHIVDEHGKLVWVNEAELQLLGYDREEFLQLEIGDIHADAEVLGHCMRTVGAGGELTAYPARLRAKDGTLRHVLINSNGYYERDGAFVHTRCFSSEISPSVYRQLLAEVVETKGV